MASSSASAAQPAGKDPIEEMKRKLYDQCTEQRPDTVFHQDDLLAFDVIPGNDLRLLLQITQRLCNEKLLKVVREASGVGWMYRSVADAAKSVIL